MMSNTTHAWGDSCYCSGGDYFYSSHYGEEGVDYGTGNGGYCNLDDITQSIWHLAECTPDPYGHSANYASWDVISYPAIEGDWWYKVYLYMPGEYNEAETAFYDFKYYPNGFENYPDDEEYVYGQLNQSLYNDMWVGTSGSFIKNLDKVYARTSYSCDEGQKFAVDDMVARYCDNYDIDHCDDDGFPTGSFSPYCGPNF